MRIRGLLLVGLMCAGCFGGSAQPPRDPHLGVKATFPAGWSVRWRPCRACADPRGIFDAASYRTAERGRGLVCSAVPNGEVVLSLDEVLPGPLGNQAPARGDYPPRPGSFRIGTLARLQVFEAATPRGPASCGSVTPAGCSMRGRSSAPTPPARCAPARRPC